MADKVIEPLSAWPETEAFKTPDGLPAYRVTPRVLTPGRARVAAGCVELAKITVLLGCAACFLATAEQRQWLEQAVVWLVICAVACKSIQRRLPPLFRKRTEIEMTTTTIGLRSEGRWYRFPREVEHRFILLAHDNAVQEQRANDIERAAAGIDRQVPRVQHFYADAGHVVLELAGHRHDLLEVYGPLDANAILARLLYLDRLLDAALQRGSSRPEWTDAPGDIK